MSLSNIVASLRRALLVDALGQTSWLDKPPHHVRVILKSLWKQSMYVILTLNWMRQCFFQHCVVSVQIWSFFWSVFLVFSPNTGKCGPEKFCIWTFFTQCRPWIVGILYQISNIKIKYIHCWFLRNLWVINNEVVLKSWITWSCRSLGQIAVTCKCF